MSLEERFEQLEKENTELKSRVETLERKGGDIFVTVQKNQRRRDFRNEKNRRNQNSPLTIPRTAESSLSSAREKEKRADLKRQSVWLTRGGT